MNAHAAPARTPLGKYAAMVRVTDAFITHAAIDIEAFIREDIHRQFDYRLRPWARYDRPVIPPLRIFGERTNRVLAWIDRRFR